MAQKEVSQRQLRVGQEIKRVLTTALERGEVHSAELLDVFITITEVRISPDLKYATAYIMTLNGKNLGQTLEKLNEDAWIFKKQIAAKLQLRYTPELTFRADDTFVEVDKIEKLLRDPKVAQDLKKSETEENN